VTPAAIENAAIKTGDQRNILTRNSSNTTQKLNANAKQIESQAILPQVLGSVATGTYGQEF
jgi:hypothetical protein